MMAAPAKLGNTVFYIATVGVLVAGALFHLWQGYLVMSLKWEVSALQSEYQRLSREGDKLTEQFLALSNLEVVESMGKRQGFAKPEPNDLIVLYGNGFNSRAGSDGVAER